MDNGLIAVDDVDIRAVPGLLLSGPVFGAGVVVVNRRVKFGDDWWAVVGYPAGFGSPWVWSYRRCPDQGAHFPYGFPTIPD